MCHYGQATVAHYLNILIFIIYYMDWAGWACSLARPSLCLVCSRDLKQGVSLKLSAIYLVIYLVIWLSAFIGGPTLPKTVGARAKMATCLLGLRVYLIFDLQPLSHRL